MKLRKVKNSDVPSFICETGINNKFEKTNKRSFLVVARSFLEAKYNLGIIVRALGQSTSQEQYNTKVNEHTQLIAQLN